MELHQVDWIGFVLDRRYETQPVFVDVRGQNSVIFIEAKLLHVLWSDAPVVVVDGHVIMGESPGNGG